MSAKEKTIMPTIRTAIALTLTLAAAPLVAHELHYAYCEGRSCVMDGASSESMHVLMRQHGRAALIEVDGKQHIVTDPATLDRIKQILAPQMELGRKQAALGAEQAKLGSQQAALGARQAALALDRDAERERDELQRRQSELGRQQSELGRRQSELGRQQEAAAREAKKKLSALWSAVAASPL